MRFLLACVGALAVAGCGENGPAPPVVGGMVVVTTSERWPDALRKQLDLEPLNTTDWIYGDCRRDVSDRSDWVSGAVPAGAQRVRALLGEAGGMWTDRCAGGQLKVGVPYSRAAPARVRGAHRWLRRHDLDGTVTLVAVNASIRQLERAHKTLVDAAGRTTEITSGLNLGVNGVDLGVAGDDGWDDLRDAARRAGVTVVMERTR